MKELAIDLWNKYKSWPWWGKLLGVVVLMGVLLLLILSLIHKPGPRKPLNEIDNFHDDQVDEARKELADEQEALQEEIKEAKKNIAKGLNTAGEIDQDTLKKREQVAEATTMDELDKMQKEWGL